MPNYHHFADALIIAYLAINRFVETSSKSFAISCSAGR